MFFKRIKKDKSFLVLSIILLGSFLIRVSLIDDSFYYSHPDKLFRPAEELVREGRLPMEFSFIGDTGAQLGPILVYLFSIFLFIWNDIYTLYLFSIALWCIAAFFVYKIGREFFSAHTGLIASIFMSFHALSLFATTDNSEAIFAAPFIAMFIYSLFQIKFKEDTRYWILCLSSLGFLLQIHASVFSCVFILVAFLFFLMPRLDLKYISFGILVLLLLFLPYLVHLVKTDFSDIRLIGDYLSGGSASDSTVKHSYLRLDNFIYLPGEKFYHQFSRFTLIALLYFIPYLFYSYWRKRDIEKVRKYRLLILTFIFSYFWLSSFPYLTFYNLTFLFVVTCLINAEFLNALINLYPEKKSIKTVLVMLIYLILIFWAFSNIRGVNKILNDNKAGNGLYFRLEKQVAESILRHSPKSQEKLNLKEVDYTDLYTNHPPNNLPNLFYYKNIIEGQVTRYLLEKERWYPPYKDKIYLVIPQNTLSFKKVKSEFSEQIDDYFLINFNNEINKTVKFSTEYSDDWFLEGFNDSNWKTTELPIDFCSLANKVRRGSWIRRNIPEEGIFLRLKLTTADENSDKTMLIASSHDRLFPMEIYINGHQIYKSKSINLTDFNKTYEISSINKYLKTGDNIIGFYLKRDTTFYELMTVFVLTESP